MNILWIKADPLYPLDSGGKIRTFQMLKEWNAWHDITFLALFPAGTSESAKTHASSYSTRQAWIPWRDQPKQGFQFYLALLRNLVLSRIPYVIDKYRSAGAAREIANLDRLAKYDLVVADFLTMTPNILAAGIQRDKVVVFQHNVESQIWKRHFESASNPLLKIYMYIQWRRYDRFERKMCKSFKGVIAVSEDDALRFQREFGLQNILGHVPTGVDVEYFSAVRHDPQSRHIVFLGSMDWMPNIDGVVEFVRTVLPKIKALCPGTKLTIIGRNPTPAVYALQEQDSCIHVTGTVDDVRAHLSRAAVSIVPLRVGGGTRIKIFEAMAMGIPVVSSTIGAEGLPVKDGGNIYIADDPDTFARRVVALLDDASLAHSIGQAGKAMVSEKFSWESAVSQFDRMCARAIAPSQPDSVRRHSAQSVQAESAGSSHLA
jgi:glycosyltransferase involved in cell wall biosynthesis